MNLVIKKYDNLHFQLFADNRDYFNDVKRYFTVYKDGYQYMPAYRNGVWNGKISLIKSSNILPYGLVDELITFTRETYPEITINVDDEYKKFFSIGKKITVKTDDLNIKCRDYQKKCVEVALEKTKGLVKVVTGGGKSLIIAYIVKNLLDNKLINNCIIIVPTLALVSQFKSDLIEYGFDDDIIGCVNKSKKEFDKKIVVSTYQSLSNKLDKCKLYDAFFIDEVHQGKSDTQQKILGNFTKQKYRYGFTGTFSDNKLDNFSIKSYIGEKLIEYKAEDLQVLGYLSRCNIQMFNMNYLTDYQGEYNDIKEFVFRNPFRMRLLKYLIGKLDDNILLLVTKVEKEGKVLQDYFADTGKEVILLDKDSKVEEREYWRNEFNNRKNIVLIATYTLFSTGVNIPSLKYIIFGSPLKSKIKVLQSIGRGLRVFVNKTRGMVLFDINDKVKFLEKHTGMRLRYYESENFNIKEKELYEKI